MRLRRAELRSPLCRGMIVPRRRVRHSWAVNPTRPGPCGNAPESPLPLFTFGLALAIWPVLVVHGCYLLSLAEGQVPLCNPYWDGCTSISRAGRHGWAFFLFKAGMLPYASGLAAFWWICQRWLRALGDAGSKGMVAAGLIGATFLVVYATFLVVYATFLGSDGAVYQWLRRSGIHVYFSMIFLAQALLVVRLRRLQRSMTGNGAWPRWLMPALVGLSLTVAGLGLAFALIGRWLDLERDRLENAIEWVAALAMQASLLLTVLGWRATDLRLGWLAGERRR